MLVPKAFPTATTGSPTIRSLDVPTVITGSFREALILMTARSVLGSCEMSTAYCKRSLVGQRHFDFLDAVDHVVVGQDVAAFVDDDAGAHAVDVLRPSPRR